jgi:BirA family transcriptional regulator, biotin operon repressor / biotin---[acetyl-CoA-carboxylase] ligase
MVDGSCQGGGSGVVSLMDGSSLHFIDSYHLLSYDTIDSTEAKRLALAGGQHGAVIWAEEQTEGKGRDGRTWISDAGNLFCSLLLQPCAPHSALPQLSFVASLSLYRALESVVPATHELRLKWPNDLLLDGKKLAGILLETIPAENSDARWVILGMGVNVEHFPQETRYPATSLKAVGVEIISAKIVLSRFLNFFEPIYDEWLERGFNSIRTQWLECAAFVNKPLTLTLGETKITGIFHGIDDGGQLLLQNEQDEIHAYAAGDLTLEMSHVIGD